MMWWQHVTDCLTEKLGGRTRCSHVNRCQTGYILLQQLHNIKTDWWIRVNLISSDISRIRRKWNLNIWTFIEEDSVALHQCCKCTVLWHNGPHIRKIVGYTVQVIHSRGTLVHSQSWERDYMWINNGNYTDSPFPKTGTICG